MTDSFAQGANRWRQEQNARGNIASPMAISSDSIEIYLSTAPRLLPPNTTVLQFWDHERAVTPRLAAMGLAYTSAPG